MALSLALISGALAAEDTTPAEPSPADATATGAPAAEDTGAPAAPEPAAAEPSAAEPSAAEPGPGVEEDGPGPEGDEVPGTPKGDEVTREVYEYIEDLTITGPGAKVRVGSNVLVVVTTEGRRIRVEVRPRQGRELTKPDDPTAGKVALIPETGENTSWAIKPQSAVFDFTPGPRGVVSIEGPSREAGNEAITVLSQGPGENTPKENRKTGYRIEVRSDRRPLTLEGRQETKDLWVDWALSGSGTFEVGGRGWEMDMDFVLPEGPVDVKKRKATLDAQATMRYSSNLEGPQAETTLVTTLTLKHKKSDYTYVRKSWLRPGYVLDETPEDKEKGKKKPAGPATKKALAGGASAWARTATLATLGVQRLAGVRETGLAMWLAQASIDSAAGRVVPRAAEKPQRKTIATVAKLSPLLEPPEGLLRDDLFSEKWLIRFEAAQNIMPRMESCDEEKMYTDGTGRAVTEIVLPDLSLSVRRKWGKRWRWGGGFDGMFATVYAGDPRVSWRMMTLNGRVEYFNPKGNCALSTGVLFFDYHMDSSTRTATGSLRTPFFGIDSEAVLWKRLAFGFRGRYVLNLAGPIEEDLFIVYLQPGLRWYFAKNAALQMHMNAVDIVDPNAVGGGIRSSGIGWGVGVTMRW